MRSTAISALTPLLLTSTLTVFPSFLMPPLLTVCISRPPAMDAIPSTSIAANAAISATTSSAILTVPISAASLYFSTVFFSCAITASCIIILYAPPALSYKGIRGLYINIFYQILSSLHSQPLENSASSRPSFRSRTICTDQGLINRRSGLPLRSSILFISVVPVIFIISVSHFVIQRICS